MNTAFVFGLIVFILLSIILNMIDSGWNWLDAAVERDFNERAYEARRENQESHSEIDSGVAMSMWGLNND
mgnify:CR=1 FL=1